METDGSTADDEATFEELLPIVRRALESGGHLDLMGLASATLAIVVHPAEPAAESDGGDQDRAIEHVVRRAVDHGSPESLAYAAAMAALVPPGALQTRLRDGLDGAAHELPRWLAEIDRTRVEAPTIVRDLFDDDEWLLAGIRFSDDDRASFRVSIDHGADGAVVDAALMHQSVDEVRQQLRASAAEDEVTIADMLPGELAARYGEAAAMGDTLEPTRTDTWPSSRPLVDWLFRLAPGDDPGR
ncbi:MAG TPA: hypothetical protein VIY72_06710 [Acidimicrobiales bacterium]